MEPSDGEPAVERIVVGALEANCYIITAPGSLDALVIDPGAEPERILDRVRALGVHVVGVIHTHGHFDHISATEEVLAGLPAPVPTFSHASDAYLYTREARAMGAAFGYPVTERPLTPDQTLVDTMSIPFGAHRLTVIHTPGHTPGSVSLLCPGRFVISGDTLFRRGIGRTDLPGGDEDAIYESILTRLYPLAPALRVYPGHGDATTIGEERQRNPFVQLPG
jgi:glyoxylase-like metal-dependent hydrolase (beta-lactamase superfamily II)